MKRRLFFTQIYQFPDCDSDEDEEFKQQDKELKACIPFAVVGSSTVLEVAGKKVRGRQYPWGVVEGNQISNFFSIFKILDACPFESETIESISHKQRSNEIVLFQLLQISSYLFYINYIFLLILYFIFTVFIFIFLFIFIFIFIFIFVNCVCVY